MLTPTFPLSFVDVRELIGEAVQVSSGAIDKEVDDVQRCVRGKPRFTDLTDEQTQNLLLNGSEWVDDGADSEPVLREASDIFESHLGCVNVFDAEVVGQEYEEPSHVFQDGGAEEIDELGFQFDTSGGLDPDLEKSLEIRRFTCREPGDQYLDGTPGARADFPVLHGPNCRRWVGLAIAFFVLAIQTGTAI
ncbi:MAG: hypothetical protein ACOYEV_15355 [Candidatus Nanopelagicales bacterium]